MSPPNPPTTKPPPTTSSSSPQQIFTSIRYDPLLATHPANNLFDRPSPFYMLAHHRDRLLAAAQHFDWPAASTALSSTTGLETLTETLAQTVQDAIATTPDSPTHRPPNSTPFRLRILVSPSGTIATEYSPTPPAPLSQLFPTSLDAPQAPNEPNNPTRTEPWVILLDTQPTPPTPYTTHKTTLRAPYVEARTRAHIPSMASAIEVLLYNPRGEITEGSLTSVYFFRGGRWVTPAGESGGNLGTTRRWALERGLCVEGCVRVESVRGGERVWVSNGVRGFVRGVVRLPS